MKNLKIQYRREYITELGIIEKRSKKHLDNFNQILKREKTALHSIKTDKKLEKQKVFISLEDRIRIKHILWNSNIDLSDENIQKYYLSNKTME